MTDLDYLQECFHNGGDQVRPPLVIDTYRPGWSSSAILRFAVGVVALFLSVQYRPGADLMNQVAKIGGIAFVAFYLIYLLDRTYATYRLEAADGEIRIFRRGLFINRSWRCTEAELFVRGVDIAEPDEGAGHRFLDLVVRQKRVRFMDGCSEEALFAARNKLWRWLDSRPG